MSRFPWMAASSSASLNAAPCKHPREPRGFGFNAFVEPSEGLQQGSKGWSSLPAQRSASEDVEPLPALPPLPPLPCRLTIRTLLWAFLTLSACARVGSGKASKAATRLSTRHLCSCGVRLDGSPFLQVRPQALAGAVHSGSTQPRMPIQRSRDKQRVGSRWVRVPTQIRQTPQRCSAGIRGEAAAHSLHALPATAGFGGDSAQVAEFQVPPRRSTSPADWGPLRWPSWPSGRRPPKPGGQRCLVQRHGDMPRLCGIGGPARRPSQKCLQAQPWSSTSEDKRRTEPRARLEPEKHLQ